MSPYTLTFRTSSGLLIKHFAYVYDAKHVMANDFLKQTEHILSFNKQGDFNIFVSLPTGLRVVVAAFAFNSTSAQEIANIIRNAAATAYDKLIVHLRHLYDIDQDVLFTLTYNPEADA